MRRWSITSTLGCVSFVCSLGVLANACSSASSEPAGRPAAGAPSTSGGSDNVGGESFTFAGAGNNINTNMGGSGDMPDETTACATGAAQASRSPVYLQFVLDGSGSMNGPGSWVAARDALKDIFTDMKTTADKGLGAGLIVFMDLNDPNLNTNQDPKYPSSADVAVDFVSDAQLQKLIARTAPPDMGKSNTPTGLALKGAYDSLTGFKGTSSLAPDGKKVVVLITDGAPTDHTCKSDNKGPNADYSQNGCVDMAKTELALPGGSIETFVIGVGPLMITNTYDPYFLGALAVAGGSAPKGCDPKSTTASSLCFFSIDPGGGSDIKQAFMTAINQIRGSLVSCTLELKPEAGAVIDADKVRVMLNDMPVYNDPVDGWAYDDPTNPTHVTLNGKSCQTLTTQPDAKIEVVLGCAIEMPPVK